MGKVQEIRESELGQELKEKGKKGISRAVFGRSSIILLLLLIQIGILFLVYDKLQNYITVANWFFILMAAATVVVIINRKGNPAFKLAWMVPLTVLPVFGILLYLFVELQPLSRMVNGRLNEVFQKMKKYMVQDPQVCEHLKEDSPRMANLAYYMKETAGYAVYENSEAMYFPSGEEKFRQLLIELEKAEHFIFMEYFIVADGYMWNSILEVLKRKARQGVEVRFMYDGTNTLTNLPPRYPAQLKKYGIQCKIFNPIRPALSTVQNNRDHRKIVVIDGHTAFTGGVNLADEYINRKNRFGHWKDTAIMIKGDAVRSFTWMFLHIWDIDVQNEDYEKYLDVPMPEKKQKVKGYVLPYADSPLDGEPVGELVYMNILNTAKEYVHIMTPYLILDNEMVTALTFAAKRGVDVKIIMPDIPDKTYAFVLAKTYYPELLEAGVKIYQYGPGFVHAKVFTSDDEKAVVGTINLDYRSLYLHFECAALLYKMEEVHRIEEDFQETLERCREITMESYNELSFFTRLLGKVLRLVAPLM